MKQILPGLAAIVLISGCSTAPPPPEQVIHINVLSRPEPQLGKFVVQIVEIENASGLIWDMVTKGETSEETLEQGMVIDLFNANQPFELEGKQIPSHETQTSISMLAPESLQEIVDSPNTEVMAYPALYMDLGETATYDQTQPLDVLQAVEVVDGKTVRTMATVNVGRHAAVRITQSTSNLVFMTFDFYNREVAGTDAHTLENGDEAEFTYFNYRASKTVTAQTPNLWRVVGALAEKTNSGSVQTSNSWACFVRIVPPEAYPLPGDNP